MVNQKSNPIHAVDAIVEQHNATTWSVGSDDTDDARLYIGTYADCQREAGRLVNDASTDFYGGCVRTYALQPDPPDAGDIADAHRDNDAGWSYQ